MSLFQILGQRGGLEQSVVLSQSEGGSQADQTKTLTTGLSQLYTYNAGNSVVGLILPFSLALLALLGAFNLYMLYLLRRGSISLISQATTRVLLSMGVADLAVCTIGVPVFFLSDFGVPLPFYTCLLLNCMVLGSALVSSLHHVLMAYYRWTLLTQPFRNRYRLTRTSTCLHLLLCWLAGVTITCLPYMGFNNYSNLQSYSGLSSSNYSSLQSFPISQCRDYIDSRARNTTVSVFDLLPHMLLDQTQQLDSNEGIQKTLFKYAQSEASFPLHNLTVMVPTSAFESEELLSVHSGIEPGPNPPSALDDVYKSMGYISFQHGNSSHHVGINKNNHLPSQGQLLPLAQPPPFVLNCCGPPSQCLVPCMYQNVLSLGYLTYVIFLGSVGLPLLAVTILYFCIFRTIRHHCLSHQISCPGATPAPVTSPSSSPTNSLFYRRQRRVACLTILLFSIYFLSRLPFNVLNALMYACPSCYVPQWAPPIALLSTVFSAGSNPFLYVMKSRAGLLQFTRRQ